LDVDPVTANKNSFIPLGLADTGGIFIVYVVILGCMFIVW